VWGWLPLTWLYALNRGWPLEKIRVLAYLSARNSGRIPKAARSQVACYNVRLSVNRGAVGRWGAVENIGHEYLPRVWVVIQMIWIYEKSVRNINIFLSRKYM